MITEKEGMVSKWIQENGNPAIEKLTSINLEAASTVSDLLKEKGISVDALAHIVDTQEQEVSMWLAGRHNFSEKTLNDIINKIQLSFNA